LSYGREWKGGEEEVIKKAKEVCVNSQYKVEELDGKMPEDLPVADSIKRLESKEQRLLKDKKEERGE